MHLILNIGIFCLQSYHSPKMTLSENKENHSPPVTSNDSPTAEGYQDANMNGNTSQER